MKLHENKYLRKMFIAQVHLQLNVMFQFIKLSVLLKLFCLEMLSSPPSRKFVMKRNWD